MRAATEPVPLRLAPGEPPIAQYVWRADLPIVLAPRPYLHPVLTRAGTPVTEVMPGSHRQHLGASLAIPEINGSNFWGGRTFLPGRGPTWLDNHGTQQHVRWFRRGSAGFSQELLWTAYDGTPLVREERTVGCRPVDPDCWVLTFAFQMINIRDVPLVVSSPAVRGRGGAGYGGFFWRAPASATGVHAFGPDASGADALNGRCAPWLALGGISDGDRAWTLIFLAPAHQRDPWFVRTRDYPGVGSSLAAQRALEIAPGERVIRRIDTVVADGACGAQRATALAEAAETAR